MRYILFFLSLVSYHCDAQSRKIQSHLEMDGRQHDSLFNYFVNPLRIDVEGVPFDRLTIKADSAEVVKHTYSTFFVKVNPNQDSVHLKIYDQGILVDTLTKYIAKTVLLPRVDICGRSTSCLRMERPNPFKLECVKVFGPFRGWLSDSMKYTVLSFVADVTMDGKVYTEYITGDSFTESFNRMYLKSFKRDKIVLRAVVVKDNMNNIFVIPEEVFPNSYSDQ